MQVFPVPSLEAELLLLLPDELVMGPFRDLGIHRAEGAVAKV